MSVVSIRESLEIGFFENFTAESIAKDAHGFGIWSQTPEPRRSLRKVAEIAEKQRECGGAFC
jgi:hypothetical protein